jgi:Tol biopolymer transport system component
VHPEGNAIVFQQVVPNEEDAFKTDVFLLDLDSQQSTRLTTTEENEFHPKFGPSADFIVYDSAVNRMGRLYRYDFDAEKSSQLFEFADDQAAGVPVVYSVLIEAPEGYMIGGATWSPDNRELAFHVSFGSDARIYVYDFDTGRVSPLMADKAFEDVEFGNR